MDQKPKRQSFWSWYRAWFAHSPLFASFLFPGAIFLIVVALDYFFQIL